MAAPQDTLTTLNRQWADDLAHHRAAHPDGTPWGEKMPALAGCTTLHDVRNRLRHSHPEDGNRILHALLVLGQDGDENALRTVLQAELGIVVWLDRQARSRGLEDHWSAALEAMWTTIRTYPLHRHNVAPNLRMDSLKRLARAGVLEMPMDTTTLLENQPAEPTPNDPHEEATHLLSWARSQGVLSEDQLELLTRVHLGGCDYAGLGQEYGVAPTTLRQRHSRAVRQLAAAVRAAATEDLLALDLAAAA